MGMSRKRARHLMLELARRIYFDNHRTYKGFGDIAKFYGENWRPDIVGEIQKFGGYKACWEDEAIRKLRDSVGM